MNDFNLEPMKGYGSHGNNNDGKSFFELLAYIFTFKFLNRH